MTKTPRASRTRDYVAWFVLALALVFAGYVRWRLADFPLERDEGEYAYAGQLILQGIPPYSMAYNMKLPGTYLAYAGLMAIFGQTAAGIHFGLLVVSLATIGLLFFFTRDLFDGLTGAVAAISYAVLSTSPLVLGMAAHATHFVTLFGVAGTWVLWRALRSDRIWLFPASGLLLGLAFLMKQHGVFLPCFGGLATLFCCLKRRPFFSLRNLSTCLLYAAGAVLPLAAVCLWLWLAGTFDKFWFWTVQYALTYVGQVPLNCAIPFLWEGLCDVVGPNWPIWGLAAAGVVGLACSPGVPGRRAFVAAFLLFSFLCVCPGFYFRHHYFIVFLPGLTILAGVAGVALLDAALKLPLPEAGGAGPRAPSAGRRRGPQPARPRVLLRYLAVAARSALAGLAISISVAAVFFTVWQQKGFYLFWPPEQACRVVYWPNPFIECQVVGDYLKEHSSPGDRVAVIGSEPEVYFYAGRISATGYIYTYALMEPHPFARKMQEEMIAEIEAVKPKYLVTVNMQSSWQGRSDSDTHILKWAQDYVTTAYYTVGVIDIHSLERTEYRWDAEAADGKSSAEYCVRVFRRKLIAR